MVIQQLYRASDGGGAAHRPDKARNIAREIEQIDWLPLTNAEQMREKERRQISWRSWQTDEVRPPRPHRAR